MITAGIDMGAQAIKAVVLEDGEVRGTALRLAGCAAGLAAREALAQALAAAQLARDAIRCIVATGTGREEAPDKDATMTEVSCAVRGALFHFPAVRTVIDVGAEEGRAMRCDERGRILDFAVNEQCAAGAGVFAEAVARALEVPVAELGPLSLQSTRIVPMNAQCVVFAESEVVSLIHSNVPKADIARAVHEAMASRVAAMVRRVGFTPPAVLVGGLAHNSGFVEALRRRLESEELWLPGQPQLCTALGAALGAARGAALGAAPGAALGADPGATRGGA